MIRFSDRTPPHEGYTDEEYCDECAGSCEDDAGGRCGGCKGTGVQRTVESEDDAVARYESAQEDERGRR